MKISAFYYHKVGALMLMEYFNVLLIMWHNPRVVNIFFTKGWFSISFFKNDVNMKIKEDGRVSASTAWCALTADLNKLNSNGKTVAVGAKTKIQFTNLLPGYFGKICSKLCQQLRFAHFLSCEDDVSFENWLHNISCVQWPLSRLNSEHRLDSQPVQSVPISFYPIFAPLPLLWPQSLKWL